MLEGTHELVVNGVRKRVGIRKVNIASEGAAAFFTTNQEDLVRIIDIGSGTVNCATVIDGQFIDLESFTLEYGAEQGEINAIAQALSSRLKGIWHQNERIHVVGGSAEQLVHEMESEFPCAFVHYPFQNDPKFANAIGFHVIGEALYEGNQVR
jgi:plasmid segregation protein ParM